jgi:predicted MFS family arabinose efflux permease
MHEKPSAASSRWYQNVSSYQWLILAIASAGWIFDVYEGQIFNITGNQLLASVLHLSGDHPSIQRYKDISFSWFLLGGTAGGLLFGSLADRWGRKPTMAATILTYSIFSGLTYFAQEYWHVALLRFLVAMGVGGEWAVAASLVAEVFPARSRAHASGIFHATSVVGTWAATWAGVAVAAHWRNAYLIGILPALLVGGVMVWVKEPESWKRAGEKMKSAGGQMGSLKDLLGHPLWRRRALLGMLLAAIGLGTFWAITVAGQDLAKEMLRRTGASPAEAVERSKTAYGFVQTAGGGLGLLTFGPLCVWLGRKRAFAWMLIAAFVIVPITCYVPKTYGQLLMLLPIFGFLTLAIHAGFAIYFPELFPTHLRATGAGFCFNVGRTVAASILWGSGQLKSAIQLRPALCILGVLFLLGLLVVYLLPETKDQPLPE